MPAAFIVVTIGRKPPLASAKPVTTPVPSATGVVLTAEATPEVPTDTRTSPGRSAMPSAAAHVVARAAGEDRAAVGLGGRLARARRGAAGRAAWPSACSSRSGRHSPSAVAK